MPPQYIAALLAHYGRIRAEIHYARILADIKFEHATGDGRR